MDLNFENYPYLQQASLQRVKVKSARDAVFLKRGVLGSLRPLNPRVGSFRK